MAKNNRAIRIKDISGSMQEPPNSILKEQKPKKKNKKKKIIIISLILLIVLGVATYLLWPNNNSLGEVPEKESSNDQIETNPLDTESPLNGEMTTKDKIEQRPVGVMIENHTDSRPQSGLEEAELVYEAITEGGITRFLALYQISDVSEIGPVRSARVPFVNFNNEYKACYSHVGGSAEAISLISSISGFCDLNQFYLGKYYWRDTKRYAPHNVYTTTDKLKTAINYKNYSDSANYTSWGFKDDSKEEERGDSQTITINFSSASYKVDYTYDKKGNVYLRKQAGLAHKDKNSGKQISPKTVIVQHVTSWRDGQYTLMTHTGTGKANIYMDGKLIKGTWKKFKDSDRTKFYDEEDQEMAFNRGPIWIEVATATVTESSK
jgi:flagellar basal body-associated protein FliL